MRPPSLLRRVLLRLAIATLISVTATVAMLYWQYEVATGHLSDARLADTLAEVSTHLRTNPDGTLVPDLPEAVASRFGEDFFLTVTDHHGRAHFSVPDGLGHAFHPFQSDQTDIPQYFEHRYIESTETYLGVTAHIQVDGRDFWVQIVEEVPLWQTLSHHSLELFARGVGIIALLHMIGAGFLCYQSVDATLAPVRTAAEEARKIGPGRGNSRITTDRLPAEVLPLGTAINAALERLESALEAQKRFTADAAHELLTPVTVIRAHAEGVEDPRLRDLLLAETDELTEMARQLLELAELESMAEIPMLDCDLHEMAAEVLARHAERALSHGIEPRLTGHDGPVRVSGCPKALRSALSNMVKNVIQHAGGASFVEISLTPPGTIRISDDGRGVDPAIRPLMFKRFQRSDKSDAAGRGLGLAIVQQIVSMHGGTVRLVETPGRPGAVFEIDLSAAAGRAQSAAG